MPRIIKNTLLNYIPTDFEIEQIINPARIFEFNKKPIKNGEIIYLCEREIRAKDNFALQFALKKSEELDLPLKIIHPIISYEYKPKQEFIDKQIAQAEMQFKNIGLDFEVIEKSQDEIIKNLRPALIIFDFNPILKRKYLEYDKSLSFYDWIHSIALSEISLFYDFYAFTEENLRSCNKLLTNQP